EVRTRMEERPRSLFAGQTEEAQPGGEGPCALDDRGEPSPDNAADLVLQRQDLLPEHRLEPARGPVERLDRHGLAARRHADAVEALRVPERFDRLGPGGAEDAVTAVDLHLAGHEQRGEEVTRRVLGPAVWRGVEQLEERAALDSAGPRSGHELAKGAEGLEE